MIWLLVDKLMLEAMLRLVNEHPSTDKTQRMKPPVSLILKVKGILIGTAPLMMSTRVNALWTSFSGFLKSRETTKGIGAEKQTFKGEMSKISNVVLDSCSNENIQRGMETCEYFVLCWCRKGSREESLRRAWLHIGAKKNSNCQINRK